MERIDVVFDSLREKEVLSQLSGCNLSEEAYGEKMIQTRTACPVQLV